MLLAMSQYWSVARDHMLSHALCTAVASLVPQKAAHVWKGMCKLLSRVPADPSAACDVQRVQCGAVVLHQSINACIGDASDAMQR